MDKCSNYIERSWSNRYGYCKATKNYGLCNCLGNVSECSYYPEKRNKKMTTLDMMIEAKTNGKTYRGDDMLYNAERGFHDRLGKKWYGDAFNYLNDLFEIDTWQEDNTVYMTKSDAEKKYGIKIVD